MGGAGLSVAPRLRHDVAVGDHGAALWLGSHVKLADTDVERVSAVADREGQLPDVLRESPALSACASYRFGLETEVEALRGVCDSILCWMRRRVCVSVKPDGVVTDHCDYSLFRFANGCQARMAAVSNASVSSSLPV